MFYSDYENEDDELYHRSYKDQIENIFIPRGKRIKTLADCYELNKSAIFKDDISQFTRHLLFVKLIEPKIGDQLEKLLKEDFLPRIGYERHGDKNYYYKHEKFGPQLQDLFMLNQEKELEEGRLLESDLIVTTKNEEWKDLDPFFNEMIDPEIKKLIYG